MSGPSGCKVPYEATDPEGVLHQLVCRAGATHHWVGDLQCVACVYRVFVRGARLAAKAVSHLGQSDELFAWPSTRKALQVC